MKTKFLLVLAFVSLDILAMANDRVDSKSIVRLFEERNLTKIQKVRPQVIEVLSLHERNKVALAAAKSLSIDKYIHAIGDNNIHKHFTKSVKDSPAEEECRRQWGINMSSAEMIRHLAEKRLINDKYILPYLIKGLDHPDRCFVGKKCFYALKYLTRHESGDVYWARLVEDEKEHSQITSWWQHWWEKNEENHPVFDLEVEKQAKAEVMRVAKQIEEKVKPRYPELSMFSVPKELVLRWSSPLFHIEYNPRHYSLIIPLTVNRDNLPWIHISCRFQSEELAPGTGWAKKEIPIPPAELKEQKKIVYSTILKGTDIVIEAFAASKDEGLMKDLQTLFSSENSTQPTAPADAKKLRR